MTLDQYQQRMAEMQIDRGELASGFRQEMGMVSSTKPLVNLPNGLLPEPKVQIDETDYSSLNSVSWQRHRKAGARDVPRRPRRNETNNVRGNKTYAEMD